jgi:hypothetical protein
MKFATALPNTVTAIAEFESFMEIDLSRIIVFDRNI